MKARFAFLALAGAASPAAAWAQAASVTGVAEQRREDYEPVGTSAGPFLVFSTFTIDLGADSNVRATETDRVADAVLVSEARVAARSDWGRHALTIDTYVLDRQFAREAREERRDYGTRATGRIDLGATDILAIDLRADRLTQPRTDINAVDAAARPIRHDRAQGSLIYRSGDRDGRIELGASVLRDDWDDGRTLDDRPIEQDFRDFTRYDAEATVGRTISGGLGVLAGLAVNSRRYANDLPDALDRTSHGYRAEAGFSYVEDGRIAAELRGGYLEQRYASDAIDDVSGFSLTGTLRWNVRPDTTLRVNAERRVDENGTATGSGLLRTTVAAGVDYEAVHNVILRADGRITDFRYVDTPRIATDYAARVEARYLLSRLTALEAAIERLQRTGTLGSDRFTVERVTLGIRLTP